MENPETTVDWGGAAPPTDPKPYLTVLESYAVVDVKFAPLPDGHWRVVQATQRPVHLHPASGERDVSQQVADDLRAIGLPVE